MPNRARRCANCKLYSPAYDGVTYNLMFFCDSACMTAYNRRPKFQRKKKDVSPTVRKHVLAGDRHRCRVCGGARNAQIHHIHYRSEGGSHEAQNLVTLCEDCHSMVHSEKHAWQGRLSALAMKREEDGDYWTLLGEMYEGR